MNLNTATSAFAYLIISAVLHSLKGITATNTKSGQFVLSTDKEIQLEILFDNTLFSEIECGRLCFRNSDCETYAFDSTTNQCLGFSGRCQSNVTSFTSTTKLYQTKEEQTHYDITTKDFSFERSSLHRYLYISSDDRTISTHSIPNGTPAGYSGYWTYQGVRGTTKFTTSDVVYFEVHINYEVIGYTTPNYLVFEIAFSTENTIDDYVYVGYQQESWSMFGCVAVSGDPIELKYRVNGGDKHTIKTLSSIAIGTSNDVVYGVYINGIKGEITMVDKRTAEVLHKFNCVEFKKQLYPVFGLWNSYEFTTNLTLTTGNDIKGIPSELFQ